MLKFVCYCLITVGLLPGCDDSSKKKTYNQVDRMGRPAIGTVFIHDGGNPVILPDRSAKNRYNTTVPSQDVALWTDTLTTALTTFRSLYGGATNDIATFAGILLPDVLTMNLSRASGSSSYLGDLLGPTSDGGRPLSDDVIDASLSVVVFPGAPAAFTSDGVGFTSNVTGTFPYLGTPN